MNEPNGFYRPTWIEVDLGAIAHNFDLIQQKLHPQTRILIPIKANAYGHGAVEVAKTLEAKGAAFLGVANVDEAVILRREGIRAPLLILNAILAREIDAVLEYDLTQTVCTEEDAKRLDQQAERWKKKIPVHLKVDTGMGRLGIWHEEGLTFARFVNACRHLFLEGLFTHLANADDTEPDVTDLQISRFTDLVETLKKERLLPPFVHIANSAGVLKYPASHFNLVRPGLAIYGIDPFGSVRNRDLSTELQPALRLMSRIVYLKKTPEGRRISYGGTYTTQKETMIATLPIGYADGYNRLLSNRGQVKIRGELVPVLGQVSMDLISVDLTDIPDPTVGEEVLLLEDECDSPISASAWAKALGSSPYEVFTSIGSRVERVSV